jgi:hypothetical protein
MSEQEATRRRRAMVVLMVAALFAIREVDALAAGPPFPQCPSVGADTSCAILLLIDPDGSLRVKTDPTQGPFDGIEDTLVGVQNNSSKAVLSIPLSGPNDIFGFDNDGICVVQPHPGGCPFGPTGYEGPGVSFSGISADKKSGVVSFAGGLQPGASTYFGLEEAIETLCPPIAGVPLLKQSDAQWRCDTYGGLSASELTANPKCTGGAKDFQPCSTDAGCPGGFCCKKKNTIGRYGCNLTSAAMIINYNGGSTTPALLNTWLADNGGYDAAGGVIPSAVVQYAAQESSVTLYYHGSINKRDDFVVDQYICSGDPMMLRVTGSPHHFVVATGQTTVGSVDTYSINDPGHPQSTLQGYGFTYDGIRKYSSQPKAPNALYVRAHSPVELLLKSPTGQATGRSTANEPVQQDIPDSSYATEALGDDEDNGNGAQTPEVQDLEVIGPAPGTYVLEAWGTGFGPFTIEIIGYDNTGKQEREEVKGLAVPGAPTSWAIDFTPGAPGGSFLAVTAITPVVTCGVDKSTLWPPNHKLSDVGLSFDASGGCDADPPSISLVVSSDESPAEEDGAGGAEHCPDAVSGSNDSVSLRAERSGSGDGRVYVITVLGTDNCGNVGTCQVAVTVPKNKGAKGQAVDSGQDYDPSVCGGEAGGHAGASVDPGTEQDENGSFENVAPGAGAAGPVATDNTQRGDGGPGRRKPPRR